MSLEELTDVFLKNHLIVLTDCINRCLVASEQFETVTVVLAANMPGRIGSHPYLWQLMGHEPGLYGFEHLADLPKLWAQFSVYDACYFCFV